MCIPRFHRGMQVLWTFLPVRIARNKTTVDFARHGDYNAFNGVGDAFIYVLVTGVGNDMKNRDTGKQRLDMLHGSLWDKIPRFALPIAATAILGQLFNAADIAVVGNFAGDVRTQSVAAVGANGAIIGLIVQLFIGAALGGRDVREYDMDSLMQNFSFMF